jgi:hypothetical protein
MKRGFHPYLIGVVLLSFLLRLIFFNGVIASDDVSYYSYAQALIDSNGLGDPNHQASRLILLALVALPAAFIGDIGVAGLINLLISTSVVWIIVIFCQRQIGLYGAIAAGLLFGLHVPDVVHAGVLLPEQLLTLLMLAATFSLFRAGEHDDLLKQRAFVLFSGVLTALAYSAKEPGILLGIPSGLYLALNRHFGSIISRSILLGLFGAGFFLITAIDAGILYLITDDILFKQHGTQLAHNFGYTEFTWFQIAQEAWWKVQAVILSPFTVGLPLALGLVGQLAILKNRANLIPVALSGLFISAYLLFGSSSFEFYIPLAYQERYLIPAMAYAAVCFGYLVQKMLDARPLGHMARIPLALLAIVALVTTVTHSSMQSGRIFYTELVRNAEAAIRTAPNAELPIFGSRWAIEVVSTVLDDDLRGRLRVIGDVEGPDIPAGYHLLAFRDDSIVWPSEEFENYENEALQLELVSIAALSNRWAPWPKIAAAGKSGDRAEIRIKRAAARPRE